ncbi:MAG: hypothetical protein WCQ16_06535 [Verrucomicrobiae bacterium]
MKVLHSKYDGEETFSMPMQAGDLVMHFPTDALAGSSVHPADFWLLDRPVEFAITSKFSDLPPWFTLHPTEMEGELAQAMIGQLQGRASFSDPVYAPNAWRVKEGDRIAFFFERPWTKPTENGFIIDIGENSLVYWQLPGGGLPNMLDAFGASPAEDDEKRKRWMQEASASIGAMGLPRTCALDWGIARQ